jgi:Protein of unknown function (DUF3761)
MNYRNPLGALVAAPLLMLAWTLSAQAQDASAPTTCKDGTTSAATGRGACSGHGGVQKPSQAATGTATPATKAPAPAAPAATPAATPPPSTVPPPAAAAKPAAPATTAKPAASAPSSTSGNTDPTGATAKCKDGTYSKSQHRSGTCSSHGGVAEWLTPAAH